MKIKNSIDLKQLENFGYCKVDNGYQKDYVGEASPKDIDLYYNTYKNSALDNYFCAGISIFIDIQEREINVAIEIYGYYDIQTDFLSCDKEYYLKDLIKSNFIEKEQNQCNQQNYKKYCSQRRN